MVTVDIELGIGVGLTRHSFAVRYDALPVWEPKYTQPGPGQGSRGLTISTEQVILRGTIFP